METLQRNWSLVLGNLFAGSKSELTISTPFLSNEGVDFLIKSISKDFEQKGFLRIITNLSPRNIGQRATNPFSFGKLYDNILSKTIAYLLSKFGPLTVIELHEHVRSIHSDLCGDAHRISNGRDYGLLWQYQVRTALVTLTKQNKVEHIGGRSGV